MTELLTKDAILDALRTVNTRAKAEGVTVDLAVYGGAAMVIVYDARPATRDVDAVVRGKPDFMRLVVQEIAHAKGWPEDWLNDGVKGFLSAGEEMERMREFPGSPAGGLRVVVPTARYLFAMKAMAMRSGGLEDGNDIPDIESLADLADIPDVETALQIVESFYPSARIPPKVRFGVEDIMERVVCKRSPVSPKRV